MSFLATDILTILHLCLQAMFLLATLVFAISALDDLSIDLYFFYRYLVRKYRLTFKYKALSIDQLMIKPEQPFALMLPAWQEANILYDAVSNILYTVNYSNFHIFIGVYPNDVATQSEANKLVAEFRNVHSVVTPLPGPTCKADCLNSIINSLFAYEQREGIEFVGVVMHDAEDIVHPLSLKLFNHLISRFDLIQLPVFPLPREWTDLTGGHYMDEFAEHHSKEILAREYLAGIVPGAGVGTAYSRRTIKLAAERGEIFNTNSLTEDYEFSTRMRNAGLKQIFARVPIVQTMSLEMQQGEQRDVAIKEIIATREYFPSQFWAAVRQKTRWTIGIALQGWQSLGWEGNLRMRYLLWRDRKMLFFSHAILLGYVSMAGFLALYMYHQLYPDAYQLAPLLEEGHPFWWLVHFNLLALVYRIVQRHIWTYLYYGWKELPMLLPRYVCGSIINYIAVCRAIAIFLKYLINGQKIGWDKTAHDFPDENHLKRYKQRLGELLVELNYITYEQLADVIEEWQDTRRRRLGRSLLDKGFIDEDRLLQALSMQLRIPVKTIDASVIDREVYRELPFDLLRQHRVVPLQRSTAGRLVVACEVLPEPEVTSQIEQAAECEIEFRLATEADISYGLHLLAMFTRQEGDDQSLIAFGSRLVELGLLSEAQYQEAARQQREAHKPFGAYVVERGFLTQEELESSVAAAAQAKTPLGMYLVENGYLSERASEDILALMRNKHQRLERILVKTDILLQERSEERTHERV
jgi:adsorption protein B